MNKAKKLYRSKTDRIIFGVCGGLGEYFEVDPLILRILFILLTFTGGSGIIIYIILAILIPDANDQKSKGKSISDAQEKTQELAEDIKGNGNWFKSVRNIIGLIIVFIGLDILFEQVFNINPFSFVNWSIVLALIIILIGLKVIFGNKKQKDEK